MKKLHIFLLKSFAGPFLVTFIIAMFVLVMQFLWLWVDELVGKGLGTKIIAELLFYQSTTLIPLALPISILLSCIMTFGGLGQHYEMVAMKAAGIPLRKIMMPIFVFCIGLSFCAFYIANVVVPDSVLKSKLLLYDVQQKKPAFNIKEGIFYNGIENFSIKVGKKSADGKHIDDVMIYDHSSNKGAIGLVIAKKGVMEMSADTSYLFFTLYDGIRYEELESKGARNTLPFDRTEFRKQEIVLDLTGFKMS
ncbi:MAG: LptF/LptG family permease, partial [Bacteroidetes bacterium]|nr:LptF/LptG family permease [Bacteroidota bacterium]